jgi:hypothetical protein
MAEQVLVVMSHEKHGAYQDRKIRHIYADGAMRSLERPVSERLGYVVKLYLISRR